MDIKPYIDRPIKIVSRFTYKEMNDIATVKNYLGFSELNNAHFLAVVAQVLHKELQSGNNLCDTLNINNHK